MSLFYILIDFAITFLVMALWIRMFLMRPSSFTQSNPVADIATRITDPLMAPVEKALKRSSRKVDRRPLLLIFFLVGAHILLATILLSGPPIAHMVKISHDYLRMLVHLYLILILSFTVLYKYSPYSQTSIIRLGFRMVEPLFELLGRVSRIFRDHIGVASTMFVVSVYAGLSLMLFALIPDVMFATPPGYLVAQVAGQCLLFLPQLATFLMYVVIAGALMSWLSPDPGNALVQLIHFLSEPLNRPARRILPSMGGIDFSPIITIVALSFIAGAGHRLMQVVMSGLMGPGA